MLLIHNPSIIFFLHKNPRSSIQFRYSMSSSFKVVAEYAKSGRSSCKKCSKTIPAAALRLGLSGKDPRGFETTRWHHVNCFPLDSESISISSPDSFKGFSRLKSSDQDMLKKLVSERDQSSEKSDEVEETELKGRNLKKRKVSDGDQGSVEGRKEDSTSKHLKPDEVKETELKGSNLKKRQVSDGGQNSVEGRKGDGTPKHLKTGEDVETDAEVTSMMKEKVPGASGEGGELELFFSRSDITDKFKDAVLPPKWKAFQTLIFLERDDGLKDSKKIAAFDFDGCLAKTSVKRVGADAWSLMYRNVPEKLQSLYNDGYKLVIFTNESNIERWKNKRQVAVDSKIGRLESFIKLVKVPIQVFIACGVNHGQHEDPFRKPKTGMWHIMKQQFNSGIPIDLSQSFYVGDAAGRREDHSDADLKFALATGLRFWLPEVYFY